MKKNLGLLLIICLIIGIGQTAKSASTDNVSGWAWSETIGWISFNNTNCDTDDNGFSNGGAGCPPVGTAIAKYGVNIDSSTGNFSGYAWSENIGWINFSPVGPYPVAPNYSAKFNFSTKKVTGWIRAEANGNGWDGWILMGKESIGWTNQVTIDSGTGEFHGWAWGSDVVGWISFNCADRPGNLCQSKSNYKVTAKINFPPSISCNDNETWNYCADSRNPTLSWNYSDPDGNPQESYQVQIDNESTFISPITIDTDEVFSSGNSYHPTGTTLQWNTDYYWRVKVKDNTGNWSNWCSPICSFTTPKHAYPNLNPPYNFIWSPQNPSVMEPVQFTDNTEFYNGGQSWFWTFESAVPPFSVLQNPVATFSAPGIWEVTLEATDSDGYKCSAFDIVNVNESLPEWKEVKPK